MELSLLMCGKHFSGCQLQVWPAGTLDIHVGMGLGGIAESIIASQLAKVYKSIPIVVNK